MTFAIEGGVSRELLSFMGRVIVHDNLRELEFLFPKYRDGQVRFVEVELDGDRLRDGRPTMPLKDHPDMDMVTWPINPANFVRLTGQTKAEEAQIVAAAIRRSGQRRLP